MSLHLSGTKASLTVDVLTSAAELNESLPWAQPDRHWQFEFSETGFSERLVKHPSQDVCVSRVFAVRFWVVLHEPPREPLPSEYEYDTPFPSAGLPSLGKR